MQAETYAKAVAEMLRQELRLRGMPIKAIMSWTHAGERTVKGWIGAANGPRGEHLIELMQQSDIVFQGVMALASRRTEMDDRRLLLLRNQLLDSVVTIDALLQQSCEPDPDVLANRAQSPIIG